MRKSIIRAIATQARLALSALSKKEDIPTNFKRAYYLLLPEHEYARKALSSIIDMLDGEFIHRIPKEVLCQYNKLSVEEVAAYMGVGIGTVRKWVKEKQLRPVEQQDSVMFFSRKDLDELIEKR